MDPDEIFTIKWPVLPFKVQSTSQYSARGHPLLLVSVLSLRSSPSVAGIRTVPQVVTLCCWYLLSPRWSPSVAGIRVYAHVFFFLFSQGLCTLPSFSISASILVFFTSCSTELCCYLSLLCRGRSHMKVSLLPLSWAGRFSSE